MTKKLRNGVSFWMSAFALAVLCIALLAGCGGGGGSSSPSTGGGGGTTVTTVTITGTLQDTGTGTALQNRSVTISGTSLVGISNSSGVFSIAGVTPGAITLIIKDSLGTANGQYTVNITTLSGNPRNLGTIKLNVSNGVPPPPF